MVAINSPAGADEPGLFAPAANALFMEPVGWDKPVVHAVAAQVEPSEAPFIPTPPRPAETEPILPPDSYSLPGPAPLVDLGDGTFSELPGSSCDPYGDGLLPYDGGRRDDWAWGCGGSPFRTGPGSCDTWDVGPVWDVSVDGMTLWRDRIDLAALEAAAGGIIAPNLATQFGYGGGARAYAMGKLPRWPLYQLQIGYEGIEEWNAALLYPSIVTDVGDPMVDGDEFRETRQIHYRSSFHSGELNFYRRPPRALRPFWGFRYLRFTDEVIDVTDETGPNPSAGDPPINVETTDFAEFIDIKNNLIGFQVGARHDLWHINRRLTLQGFVNGGVYYNRIQFSNGTLTTTTLSTADDTSTDDFNEAGTSVTTSAGIASTEPTEIAYVGEASLTAVCRLNRCCALRGGYQLLWIDGLYLAEDVYLGNDLGRHNFVMQGWHVGFEYRR